MVRPGALTPTQQRLLGAIRRPAEPVVFDRGYIDDLLARARSGFTALSERLGGVRVSFSKYQIALVLGCERRYITPQPPFSWSPHLARGTVTHTAIELLVHWPDGTTPAAAVDAAITHLVDRGTSLGDWLSTIDPASLAELRGMVVERVTRFAQDFPPLDWRAEPITEATGRWSATPVLELAGRADLILGRPDGHTSTRLIVDLKTGRRSPVHREDLRFYALVETLQRAVPPRAVATFYLDEADLDVEHITEGVLESALARTFHAVERHLELTVTGRTPTTAPGTACRWCHVRDDCRPGREFLAALDDRDLGDDE